VENRGNVCEKLQVKQGKVAAITGNSFQRRATMATMNAYQLALEQGRRELSTAQKELKTLQLRVSQLESIVTQLEAFTSVNSTEDSSQFSLLDVSPITTSNMSSDQPPLWKAIINALNGNKGDFTVPQAVAALERTGRVIASTNRNNIVRNTIIHNKNFGRLGTGHYYVIGYENSRSEESK